MRIHNSALYNILLLVCVKAGLSYAVVVIILIIVELLIKLMLYYSLVKVLTGFIGCCSFHIIEKTCKSSFSLCYFWLVAC